MLCLFVIGYLAGDIAYHILPKKWAVWSLISATVIGTAPCLELKLKRFSYVGVVALVLMLLQWYHGMWDESKIR